MIPWLLLVVTLAADEGTARAQDPPPPLTTDQLTQVRTLVQRTQATQAEAKEALTETQEKLSRAYSKYELDADEVEKLQAVIIVQQQRLLDNHHRMQVELRKIVGAQRFQVLSKRIENALRTAPPQSTTPSSPNARPTEK